MIPIELATRLVVLLAAGSEPPSPSPTPPVGSVMGSVFTVARDTLPCPQASVRVIGTRVGTLTDETGAYVLSGLPPGRIVLNVKVIGIPQAFDTLDVAAGQTVRRNVWLTSTRSPYEMARDSLAALGQWPPKLDTDLLEHMRAAEDVRVFRLDPNQAVFDVAPDPKRRIGPWPIVHESPRPDRRVVTELVDALSVSPYELPPIEGRPIKPCGGFLPGIDVRFTREGVPVDVLLCYRCGEISIWRAGQGVQAGDFGDPRFVEFAKRVFPHDPEIRRLASPAQQH